MQPRHRVADRLEHPLHLVLAALVQDELDRPGPSRAPAPARWAVVELDALREPPQGCRVRVALDLGQVHLLDAVARVREPVREVAVVRQQEAPVVSASSRPTGTTRGSVGDEVDDGRPPLRVARGRDDAGGLVEQDVGEPLELELPPSTRRGRPLRRRC